MATTGADLADVRRIEEATLTCWPAVSTAFDRSWVIRVSEGHTGRANSINVLDPADGEEALSRLSRAASLYRARQIPPTLRATPLTPETVVESAGTLGWRIVGESLVMTKALVGEGPPGVEPEPRISDEWLEAVARCMELTPQKRAAVGRKLQLLGPPAGFFLVRGPGGRAVAALLAVVYARSVGIMDVGVDPAHRGRGHGRRLIGDALGWAFEQGAELAWLQVDRANSGAIGLYEKLGFSAAYPYAYHREVPA